MDSTKIFIDTDSELTFVLERILSTKSDRIVLVVPDRASILSSITGLKVLKRVVDKSNKLLVLVTLDDIGADLANNAGIKALSRVGEIEDNIWEDLQKEKFEVIKKQKRTHYIPKQIEEEIKETEIPITKKNQKIVDLITDSDEEFISEISGQELAREELENEEDLKPQFLKSDSDFESKKSIPSTSVNIKLDLEELSLEEDSTNLPNSINEVETKEDLPKKFETKSKLNPIDGNFDEEKITPIPIPKFLARRKIPNEVSEEKEEVIPQKVNNLNSVTLPKRVRKTLSHNNISNLSFEIGKDINSEKKK